MKKLVLMLGLMCTCALSYAGVKDSIGVAKKEGKFHIKYFVSPGETIYGISTHYGVPISTLMEVNPELENGLKVGQIIFIPYNKEIVEAMAKKEEAKKERVVHQVQPGETLFSISKQYGVEIGELLKLNGMELKAGQELVIGYKDKESTTAENGSNSESTTTTNAGNTSTATNNTTNTSTSNSGNTTSNTLKINRAQTEETRLIVHDKYDYDPTLKQVLIIPYDPHLYFSDADDEIAAVSKINRTQVREVFRKRLNALLDPEGYETIHLLGGGHSDTLTDLNNIYQSVSYNFQSIMYSNYYEDNLKGKKGSDKKGVGGWVKGQLDKVRGKNQQVKERTTHDGEKGKYFGVKIKDSNFFDYFNTKYSVDYYVFINQFEVITDYEHCLDRSTNNFRRYFITHFSIFTKDGEQIAGNKFRVYYNSNTNYVLKIVADNMPQVAARILAELPPPTAADPEKAE